MFWVHFGFAMSRLLRAIPFHFALHPNLEQLTSSWGDTHLVQFVRALARLVGFLTIIADASLDDSLTKHVCSYNE